MGKEIDCSGAMQMGVARTRFRIKSRRSETWVSAGGTGRSVPCLGGDEARELVLDCKIWWSVGRRGTMACGDEAECGEEGRG